MTSQPNLASNLLRRACRNGALALLLAILFTGAALADQVVYFKNGQAMPISSHKINGDMILVILEGTDRMTFPRSAIDRIEMNGRDVLNKPAGATPNQIQVAPVRGTTRQRNTQRKAYSYDAANENVVQENGILIERPFADQGGARARLGATGTRAVRSFRGQQFNRAGNGAEAARSGPKTLPSRSANQVRGGKEILSEIEFRGNAKNVHSRTAPGPAPAPKPAPAEGSASSGGSSSSSGGSQ